MNELVLKGSIYDGTSSSSSKSAMLPDGVVVIDGQNGRIVEVGREGEVDQPRGAEVIEAKEGETIMPGLIDAHVHFFGTPSSELLHAVITPDVRAALRSVPDLQRLLNAGFTSVRDMGSKVGTYLSQAVGEGLIAGPRVISCSKSLAQTGGDDDPTILPLEVAQELSYSYYCDGPWECRKAVRKVVRDGAEVVKVYASGSLSQGTRIRLQFTVEELKAMVDEAHRAGLRLTAHAYGEEALSNALEAGVDCIEHGIGLTDEIAARIEKKGVHYVPTISTYQTIAHGGNERRDIMIRRHLSEDMEIARKAGLKIVCGSDFLGSESDPHGTNSKEIINLAKYFGNETAVRATTSLAAECLGLADEIGSIKKGFRADVLVVRGNPLEDPQALLPERIRHVVKKGKLCFSRG